MSETWVIIISLGFILLLIALIAVLAILFFAYIELKKTTSALRLFFKNVEDNILPTFCDAGAAFRSFKNVNDNVGKVTEDIKSVSSSLQNIISNLKSVINIVDVIKYDTSIHVKGLKAGIAAALRVLLSEIISKRR